MSSRCSCPILVLFLLVGGCSSSVQRMDGGPDAASATYVDVEVFGRTSCALRSDGIGVCWGEFFPTPMRFDAVDSISAGFSGAFLMRDGAIEYVPGPEVNDLIIAQFTPPPGRYVVMATTGPPCALTEDRDLRCWGRDTTMAPPPLAPPYASVVTGGRHACVESESGRFACFSPFDSVPPAPVPDRELREVTLDADFICGLLPDGEAECWGIDDFWRDIVNPPAAGPFTEIDAGATTVCGLREDNTLACWGDYPYADLEPSGERYTRISVGTGHICAITDAAGLSCWGDDEFGQVNPPDF